MVPSRILSPAIVFPLICIAHLRDMHVVGHFGSGVFPACEVSHLSCIMIIPNEAVAMSEIIDYWGTAKNVPQGAWIAIFISLSILFNFLNVRRYGELEYWFTMTKVVTLTILIFLGILLPLGATTGGPLLGTNGTEPIHCNTINDTCLTSPGFNCTSFHRFTDVRLERTTLQGNYRHRTRRSCYLSPRMLSHGTIQLHRSRIPRNNSHGNRKS